MGINKDLNVDPYYDDFDETKQFNRVLFTPSKAVQARELTQLQTILQKQVERFGSNIYKEGSIISGVNLTARDDLYYVKISDKVGFTNATLYDEVFADDGSSTRFTLEGSSGLKAEIIKGLNGFETAAPDLKTFYISYLNTTLAADDESDIKQFGAGETLSLFDPDGQPVTINGSPVTLTTNREDGFVGKGFGVSCEPGVIYQKGHFIFVDRQFTIVTRYSSVPGQDALDPSIVNPVSIGFTVEENIVNANQDRTLLDNASGYNNYNAPGADRLQLTPRLVSYPTTNEPTEFFALLRYRDGKPIRLRDYTQYSLIGDELARRTYEESGNYVIEGINATLESPVEYTNPVDLSVSDIAQVSISPGKAFIFGREVRNLQTTKLPIDKVTATQTKTGQLTSISYDQHYEFNGANGQSVIDFNIATSSAQSNRMERYRLLEGSTGTYSEIGTCCVSGVEPGKVFVFNISKNPGKEAVKPTAMALSGWAPGSNDVLVLSTDGSGNPKGLQNPSKGCMVFDTGKDSVASITNTKFVERLRLADVALSGGQVNINSTATELPIKTDDVFGILNGQIYKASQVVQLSDSITQGRSDGIRVSFSEGSLASATLDYLFYSRVLNNPADEYAEDGLTESTGFIQTSYNIGTRSASLGVPNVIESIKVINDVTTVAAAGAPTLIDVTSSFRLVNNQKDSFYDISYIQLRAGATPPETTKLFVEIRYLDRSMKAGFLTADSYANVAKKHLVRRFTAKNLNAYDLLSCYDLRPYAEKKVEVKSSIESAVPIVAQSTQITSKRTIANNSIINSTQSYYLNRIDSVVVDEYGNMSIVKGGESEDPVKPKLDRLYEIAEINNPGNTINTTGERCITISDRINKVYRMNDIENLEKKVDNLADMVALSLSELNAKNMLVTGADGEDRFKNGILTDNFDSLIGADLGDPQFSASIDKGKTLGQPAVKQFPIDLVADTTASVDTSDTIAANAFEDVTTLEQSGVVSFIDQPYATNYRNCVSNYYNYKANIGLFPNFISSCDVIQNPKVDIELDFASSMLDLVENLQEFMPLTREGEVLSTTLESSYIDRVNRWHDGAPTRVRNYTERVETIGLTSKTKTLEQAVGNFVTDVNMKPFLPRKKIRILVTGLRPNTIHSVFCDKKNVNKHITHAYSDRTRVRNPKRLKFGPKSRLGKSAARRSDSRGRLYMTFFMPAKTFFVGENVIEVVDVDQYTSIESGSTSYGKTTLRGYNFAINKSDVSVTTRTVDFDTEAVGVTERSFQKRTRDPIAQTFRVKSTAAKEADYVYISDIDVFFKRKSATAGVTMQIRETVNGYPSSTILPFAQRSLEPEDITASDAGNSPTNFKFDNPIKLKTDSEYCFVVIPDGNSPEYLIHTSKVGETSKSKGLTATKVAVTNDWGDGALFTSTNDSAWRSYQDEDIKFTINRYDFDSSGSLELIPNNIEFLKLRENAVEASDGTTLIPFIDDETAYVLTDDVEIDMSISGDNFDKLTVRDTILGTYELFDGDYLLIKSDSDSEDADNRKIVSKILSQETVTEGQVTNIIFTLETPIDPSTVTVFGSAVKVRRCIYGEVSYYNPKDRTKLHLSNSSARSNNYIDNSPTEEIDELVAGRVYTITSLGDVGIYDNILTAWREKTGQAVDQTPAVGDQFVAQHTGTPTVTGGADMNGRARPNEQVVYGLESGASAKISSVTEEHISYFQPQVQIDESMNTSASLELLDVNNDTVFVDKPISLNSNVYTTNRPRKLISKSKQLNDGMTKDPFRIKVNLSSSISTVTPVLDTDLAEANIYQYKITDTEATTSNWVSKEVILNDQLPAKGLRVILSAYRPPGTNIDVYGRFVYADNTDSDKESTNVDSGTANTATVWKQLAIDNPKDYSNTSNFSDYREFTYNLDESVHTDEFSSFQIRLVLRHSTQAELNTPEFKDIEPGINLFPTIYEFRALAVT